MTQYPGQHFPYTLQTCDSTCYDTLFLHLARVPCNCTLPQHLTQPPVTAYPATTTLSQHLSTAPAIRPADLNRTCYKIISQHPGYQQQHLLQYSAPASLAAQSRSTIWICNSTLSHHLLQLLKCPPTAPCDSTGYSSFSQQMLLYHATSPPTTPCHAQYLFQHPDTAPDLVDSHNNCFCTLAQKYCAIFNVQSWFNITSKTINAIISRCRSREK